MHILFDIGHPAHVHLFKNFIAYLKKSGHSVYVVSRGREYVEELLAYYGIEHRVISNPKKGTAGRISELIARDRAIFALHRKHRFDVAFGTSVSIGHLAAFTKAAAYDFSDNDDSFISLHKRIAYPFDTGIIQPDCIRYSSYKKKRILHPSFHELAYLHPNRFTPDKKVLKKYGLSPRRYVLVRLAAHQAHHDANVSGISARLYETIKKRLNGYTIVTSKENEKRQQIEPWDMHSVLAFAKCVIADSATMSNEAACLGVPALCIANYIDALSVIEAYRSYGLIIGRYPDDEAGIVQVIDTILANKHINKQWLKIRDALLRDKCDLTQWIIDFFETNVNREKENTD